MSVDKPRPGGLNNNYTDISNVNWNDHHNQVQEGKHIPTDFADPKTEKVKLLSSSIVIGQNESIVDHAKNYQDVVRVDKTDLNQKQKHAEDMNLQMTSWNNMSSSPTKKPSTVAGGPRYMEATKSSSI